MTSKSDKITMRETLQIHWRAFKDIRRYCPGAFGVSVLYGTAAALSPYVTVYLSARIINELAGARRLEVLGPLAILAVASGALLTFVTGALLRWKTAKEAEFLERKNRLFADKMLSMDFEVLSPTRHAIHRRSRGTLCVEHCGVPRRLYCVDLWNQKLLTLL